MDIGWCLGALYVILVRGRRSELRGAPAPLPTPTRAPLAERTASAHFYLAASPQALILKFLAAKIVKFQLHYKSALYFAKIPIKF